MTRHIKATLINWLHERITSLRGTRILAYLVDMSRLLRSVHLVRHLVRRINLRCLNSLTIKSLKRIRLLNENPDLLR